ncbi:MAG: acetyl-CoA carboxylase biotin carboxylase subunit [Bacteroidetes bacterium]|nr:acetyl-CoA carboxylase biotin carboxylase subunit [Bacteroidota bacterium]
MKKILVANRGEIALRIMRTCREMSIKTVAVFSEVDRKAPFVLYADEAVCIGPPPSSASYLDGSKIISAASKTGSDAIHPGYGFLSENPRFAREVQASGITFIGPPPDAIEMMGDKISAKKLAARLNIPLVPGTDHTISDFPEAKKVATGIGYPVLIKASAGGGGKGMRIVHTEKELRENLERASSEAKSAFGDGSVFIEKYIESPRHIEFQVLADSQGNVIHLFERECSIQRRHQKVIEEAPSSILTPEMRRKMGECAVKITSACGYHNAGTVEFLADEKNNFYFLEMNTRLQVEHPVTEMITGIDLVREQINIARGEKLSFRQEELSIKGHAIEARIYAEDPANGFLPDSGLLKVYRRPAGNGIRVDDGYEEGMEIPVWYDPMIAKLIVHGDNRLRAIERMLRALGDFSISGVSTTIDFCFFVINHPLFRSGKFDTLFIDNHFSPLDNRPASEEECETAALLAAWLTVNRTSGFQVQSDNSEERTPWRKRKMYR